MSNSGSQMAVIRQLTPLIILFSIIIVGAWVGYQIYLSVTKMQETAAERMNRHNVVFTKDGVRVGVKQMKNEKYVDATQSWVYKAWDLGSAAKEEDAKAKKKRR
ncbi:hypothetical protein B0I35DRAFT_476301 [Stachybotrys elegans]|uniref:Uncharacterized protein n=1 Tax=Stachybotrys elegans TaxID=80388 RepID=A0A8K0SZ52_9HYPO|nr:hypothetical protein B0I35DRAFT_476301 [Stachybotrys elegans]